MNGIWVALVGHLAWTATVMPQEAGVDSVATIDDASSAPFAGRSFEPYADFRSWIERVENRPGATEDLERARATLRAGLSWRPSSSPAEARAGFRASLGSDRNAEARAAFDNEAPDTLEADELLVRIESQDGDAAAIGKMRSPLALTEMVWDADLRPVGAAAKVSLERIGLKGGRLAAAWLLRSDWSDDAWTAGGQLAIARELGSELHGELIASYLEFHHLDDLPSEGYARQNTIVVRPEGRRYAVDFQVLDVQAAATMRLGRIPVAVRIEGTRNLATSEHADAVRTRLALGGVEAPYGLETGWVYQRIERDAVIGAFNSDDWWFHSRSRGNLGWIAWGLGRPIGVRVSAFLDHRDDLTTDVHRFRAELLARLPSR